MPTTLEERVAYLEGKVGEHSKAWADLKDMIIHLEGRMDARGNSLEVRMDARGNSLEVRMDALEQKINALDQKVDRRIDALDQKVDRRIDALDSRIDALDQKFSKFLLWIIGIQVTTLLAIIAALLR